jgi:hypothetical protein
VNHSEQQNPNSNELGNQGEPADHLETELSKYQALAHEARNAGNDELADRLDAYIQQLADQRVEGYIAHFLDRARQSAQELYSEQSGHTSLYEGPPGYPITDAVLPQLRQMILERDDLPVPAEEVKDGGRRYVVPLPNNAWYVERYELLPESHDVEAEWVHVELFKDKVV